MCSWCVLDSTAFWVGLIIFGQHHVFLRPLPSAVGGWSGWTRQWGKNSSVHCRPLWVADGVGRGNWVKILPSTGVRCELLSENRLVFNPYFSLFFSMFLYFSLFSLFFSIFLCPLKINLKSCSILLYFSLFFCGNLMVYRLANSALVCFMFLYLSLGTWVDTCIFWPSIWLQLLTCSGLARTLYPVSSWEGDSTWCFHMWQSLKTCENFENMWKPLKNCTAFDSTWTGQDLIELDTW